MMAEDTIYIVAGGPSLIGYNFNLLRNKRVIAVNRAFERLPNAEVVYFSDKRFFVDFGFGPAVMAHKGRKITVSKLVHEGVENYKLTGSSGLEENNGYLRGGNNGAYAAINLAYQLGAKKIIILGLDMKFGENGETHYHDGYKVKNMEKSFDKMTPFFPSVASELVDRDIVVLNANMDSEVDCFERIPLEVAHLV